jgi:hypothetical protein
VFEDDEPSELDLLDIESSLNSRTSWCGCGLGRCGCAAAVCIAMSLSALTLVVLECEVGSVDLAAKSGWAALGVTVECAVYVGEHSGVSKDQ